MPGFSWIQAASLALVIPLGVSAHDVAGGVVDPQGGIIVAARVELRCTDETVISQSDSRGQFSLQHAFAQSEECALSVTHPGFSTVVVPVWVNSAFQRVELQVEGLQ